MSDGIEKNNKLYLTFLDVNKTCQVAVLLFSGADKLAPITPSNSPK